MLPWGQTHLLAALKSLEQSRSGPVPPWQQCHLVAALRPLDQGHLAHVPQLSAHFQRVLPLQLESAHVHQLRSAALSAPLLDQQCILSALVPAHLHRQRLLTSPDAHCFAQQERHVQVLQPLRPQQLAPLLQCPCLQVTEPEPSSAFQPVHSTAQRSFMSGESFVEWPAT